ncbi:MAG TPA: cyclic nucleotide-binding domain-containing protein [Burkholderiales bacterium]|nr:cyclic nucleotide-binding domain-containing protein [Burkholderiales bacterium]
MSHASAAQLQAVALFQSLDESGLRALAERARQRSLAAGRLVFKEGEPADSMYVVLSGSVKIFLQNAAGKEVVLDTKKAGEYFGEMMLDHRPRSASIMTLEDSEFAVISRDDFQGFLRQHPEAAEQVILNLIRVTRDMNQRTRGGAGLAARVRAYMGGLKGPDMLAVRRWLGAKRWVLAGLLVLAIAQYYYLDVLLQIASLNGLTIFTGR